MKKISLWCLMVALATSGVRAQETATQQQLDKLGGQIQDMIDAQALQGKRIDALEKEISDLRDKVNTPAVQADYATRDDLKKLAEQMQDIDQKRQDDRKLILEQISNLGKATAVTPLPIHHSSSTPKPPAEGAETASVPQDGYEYIVKQGDTLGLILRAYRDKGVKVTMKQVIAANPNLNPNVVIPNTKIFIPDASAK